MSLLRGSGTAVCVLVAAFAFLGGGCKLDWTARSLGTRENPTTGVQHSTKARRIIYHYANSRKTKRHKVTAYSPVRWTQTNSAEPQTRPCSSVRNGLCESDPRWDYSTF